MHTGMFFLVISYKTVDIIACRKQALWKSFINPITNMSVPTTAQSLCRYSCSFHHLQPEEYHDVTLALLLLLKTRSRHSDSPRILTPVQQLQVNALMLTSLRHEIQMPRHTVFFARTKGLPFLAEWKNSVRRFETVPLAGSCPVLPLLW